MHGVGKRRGAIDKTAHWAIMNRLPVCRYREHELYIPSMFATSCSRMTTHAFDLQYVIA